MYLLYIFQQKSCILYNFRCPTAIALDSSAGWDHTLAGRINLKSSIPAFVANMARAYNTCLFHLYLPVTRKRRWRYILDGSAPA